MSPCGSVPSLRCSSPVSPVCIVISDEALARDLYRLLPGIHVRSLCLGGFGCRCGILKSLKPGEMCWLSPLCPRVFFLTAIASRTSEHRHRGKKWELLGHPGPATPSPPCEMPVSVLRGWSPAPHPGPHPGAKALRIKACANDCYSGFPKLTCLQFRENKARSQVLDGRLLKYKVKVRLPTCLTQFKIQKSIGSICR